MRYVYGARRNCLSADQNRVFQLDYEGPSALGKGRDISQNQGIAPPRKWCLRTCALKKFEFPVSSYRRGTQRLKVAAVCLAFGNLQG
jgi:hypothetical protein